MSAESNSEELVSYQKKDGRCHVHPSFFWYDKDKDWVRQVRATYVTKAYLQDS